MEIIENIFITIFGLSIYIFIVAAMLAGAFLSYEKLKGGLKSENWKEVKCKIVKININEQKNLKSITKIKKLSLFCLLNIHSKFLVLAKFEEQISIRTLTKKYFRPGHLQKTA